MCLNNIVYFFTTTDEYVYMVNSTNSIIPLIYVHLLNVYDVYLY